MSVDTIKLEITKLNRRQKVEIMHFLIENVAEAEADDFELTEELKAELDRREAAVKNGTAKMFIWEEVKSHLKSLSPRPNAS